MHKDKRALIETLRHYKRHILGPLFTEAADTIEELLAEKEERETPAYWIVQDDVVDMIESIPAADVRQERYARKIKFYNEPWSGQKFTTCTACHGKVGPRDKFCKHCGAKFEEGENG